MSRQSEGVETTPEVGLSRQATELRIILEAIRQLTGKVRDEFKDEVWSRVLLFLMMIADQLLSQTRNIGNTILRQKPTLFFFILFRRNWRSHRERFKSDVVRLLDRGRFPGIHSIAFLLEYACNAHFEMDCACK